MIWEKVKLSVRVLYTVVEGYLRKIPNIKTKVLILCTK